MNIFLWTHPRSVSTAFERTIAERGDLEILHEPFSDLYYGHDKKAKAVGFQSQYDFPASYPNIKSHLQKLFNNDIDYFIKDMAYHCWDYLKNDTAWLLDTAAVFLIRNPKTAIASHYAINKDVQCDEIGYQKLWMLYELLSNSGKKPLLLLSESLQENPAITLQKFEQYCKLPPKPEALQWKKQAPDSWKSWEAWHKDAAQSKSIEQKKRKYSDTVENNSLLQQYYDYHLPYYEKLKSAAAKAVHS
ncbi:MAG: hypothetical protein WD048_11565 [Chitinophagales bacterium]